MIGQHRSTGRDLAPITIATGLVRRNEGKGGSLSDMMGQLKLETGVRSVYLHDPRPGQWQSLHCPRPKTHSYYVGSG